MIFLLLLISIFVFLIYKKNERYRGIIRIFFISFWSYQEMRLMIAACFVVYFASCIFDSPLSIPPKTLIPSNFQINHHHDLGGNKYIPIRIELSEPAYPIKFEIIEK